MSKSFGEMLKKNSFRCHFKELENWCKEPNPEVIPVRALGEWAWQQLWIGLSLKEMKEQAKKEEWFFDFPNVQDYFTREILYHRTQWQIVVACLGKEEVERRLKEASK